jgi:hypothetical protein
MGSEEFAILLRSEGLAPEMFTKEIYIRRSMTDILYGDTNDWIYEAVRAGLAQVPG